LYDLRGILTQSSSFPEISPRVPTQPTSSRVQLEKPSETRYEPAFIRLTVVRPTTLGKMIGLQISPPPPPARCARNYVLAALLRVWFDSKDSEFLKEKVTHKVVVQFFWWKYTLWRSKILTLSMLSQVFRGTPSSMSRQSDPPR
jgi:hypothetical protein